MNVSVENMGPCQKKISVEIPASYVSETYDGLVKEYVKAAKIKGFRPGKAPQKVVEKQYAKQLADEVRERLVPEGYRKAMSEHKLSVLQVLNVSDVTYDAGQPMKYDVQVEVAPEFDMPVYKGIPLERQKVEVPEEKVDETLQNIREQMASFEAVEGRPVQKGDLVQVDYDAVCDGVAVEGIGPETKGLGTRKDFWVRTDENAIFPEFVEGLEGASVGDQKQIAVRFPETFPVAALAGKEATYMVDVKAIREKKLPEWTPEILKNFNVDSPEQLKERIREDLLQSAEQREAARLRTRLIEHLVTQVEMELPASSVAQETNQIIQDVVRQNSKRGVDSKVLEEKRDEIVETAGRNARERVKVRFMLDRIAHEEKIEPTPSQFQAHLAQLASEYGMPPAALQAELKKREALDGVRDELRRSLLVDFLMEQAAIQGS